MKVSELASGPPVDVAIIGGGINGCAIAEEASARGLRVALFEKDDFGFGTTWRSTKLIHGGLRYLEHGDLGLVFESLHERAWLLNARSHLVRPQRFVLPVLPWTRRPAWQLRAGLALYDLLALYRGVPRHRGLSRARLRELVPALAPEASGGFTFFDARVLAPERLALELAQGAAANGAALFNHASVRRVLVEHGMVRGVEVVAGKTTAQIPVRAVVNAAGPWVDAVNTVGDLPGQRLLGVTRGTHVVVELDNPPGRDAVFSTARQDGRVFFAVPQGSLLLVGTTDDRFDGDPGAARPTQEDMDYLLEEARALLPGLDLTRQRIRYAYAGLRPLQLMEGGPEAAISRRHSVVDHREKGGAEGLFSVVGGKLSTFRPLARDVAKALKAGKRQSPMHGAPFDWRQAVRSSGLERAAWGHLRIYGHAVPAVLEGGRDEICPHVHAVKGEVIRGVRDEWATTLADVILRRTGIGWGSCRGLCCHKAVADLAGTELGWSAAEKKRQLKAFEEDVAFHLPTPAQLAST